MAESNRSEHKLQIFVCCPSISEAYDIEEVHVECLRLLSVEIPYGMLVELSPTDRNMAAADLSSPREGVSRESLVLHSVYCYLLL